MGLADFCVTRGIEIWPYPDPVFEQPEHWTMGTAKPLPARLMAFDDCSPTDRYYMLAAGYGSMTNVWTGKQKLTVLAMIDHGLLPLVRFGLWTRRRVRDILPRLPLGGHIERGLKRLLRGNG